MVSLIPLLLLLLLLLIGGRTPSYNNPGYMTPSHDPSRTPLHGGSAWDPSITNTPARTDEWSNYGSAPSPSGVRGERGRENINYTAAY